MPSTTSMNEWWVPVCLTNMVTTSRLQSTHTPRAFSTQLQVTKASIHYKTSIDVSRMTTINSALRAGANPLLVLLLIIGVRLAGSATHEQALGYTVIPWALPLYYYLIGFNIASA